MSQGLVYLNQGCLSVECFVTFLPGRESPSTLGMDLDSSLLPAFLPLPLSGEFYWWYCSHVFLFFSLILFSLKVLYSGIFLRTQNYSFIYFLKTQVVIVLLPKIFPFPWWPAFLYFDSWGSHVPLSPEVGNVFPSGSFQVFASPPRLFYLILLLVPLSCVLGFYSPFWVGDRA